SRASRREFCATAWHRTFPPLGIVPIRFAPPTLSCVPPCHREWGAGTQPLDRTEPDGAAGVAVAPTPPYNPAEVSLGVSALRRAESRPSAPDPGNAGEGNANRPSFSRA